jgi:sugar lactone lactonase YvrE
VPNQILIEGRAFLEGPRWRDGLLFLSDIPAGEVLSVDMEGRLEVVALIDGSPSGLGWLPDGTMLVTRGVPAAVMAVARDGKVTEYADLTGIAVFPPNDMVVDPNGRAWLGTCDIGGIPSPAPSQLLCIESDRTVSVVDDAMRFPNGSVVTSEGTLIVAETFGSALTAFTLASGDSGGAGEKREWAAVAGTFPDGICLDAEGAVWFADAVGHAAVRVKEGGEVTAKTPTDQGCYACTLGGPDGRTLFLLTGEFGPAARGVAERKGRVEMVTVEVPAGGSP